MSESGEASPMIIDVTLVVFAAKSGNVLEACSSVVGVVCDELSAVVWSKPQTVLLIPILIPKNLRSYFESYSWTSKC